MACKRKWLKTNGTIKFPVAKTNNGGVKLWLKTIQEFLY